MRIPIPFVRYEVEIIARRRTEPIRMRVRTLMMVTAITAVMVYLNLPLSSADCKLMATYELLGSKEPEKNMTKAQIISELGPPYASEIVPKMAPGYSWVARFETPLQYREFNLNLSFESEDDDARVIAWGLFKTESHGFELLWFRIARVLSKLGI